MKNRGLVGGLYDSLSYLYESVIQDYVESVYTDVIEGYTIATIKVLWKAALFLQNTINVSVDWLVCLWIPAGGEGSHYQPLCFRGEGLWESSGWRPLSTRDFHSDFFSFKGRVSAGWWVLGGVGGGGGGGDY